MRCRKKSKEVWRVNLVGDKNRQWDLSPLKDAIIERLPGDGSPLLMLDGVEKLERIFVYHLNEAYFKFTDQQKSLENRSTKEFLAATLSVNSKYGSELGKSEAHAFAAILILRPIYEVFSQLANRLLLDPPISEAKCRFNDVCDRLSPGPLKSELVKLSADPWFKYFNAFVNVIKHRNVVKSPASVDLVTLSASKTFDRFDYNNNHFPAYSYEEVLQGMKDVKNRLIGIGNALNIEYLNLRDA